MKHQAPHNGSNIGSVFARVLGLTALFALLVLIPANALAAPGHKANGAFGAGDFPAGPTGIAVEQSTGDVYVSDPGNSRVAVYDSAGFLRDEAGPPVRPIPIDPGTYSGLGQIALDPAGFLYVEAANVSDGSPVVLKLDLADNSIATLDASTSGTTINGSGALAVDPTTHSLYVTATDTLSGGPVVDIFDSSGVFVSSFNASDGPGFACPNGVAVDSASHVFVSDPCQARVDLYDAAGAFQENVDDGAAASAASIAVDPTSGELYVGENGPQGAQVTDYGTATSHERLFTFGAGQIAGIAGLAADHGSGDVYVADNGSAQIDRFSAFLAPSVTTGIADAIDSQDATLHGTLNPHGVLTSYHFEWGIDTSYGNSTPSVNAGNGIIFIPATATIGGLTPNTTYHYRLVASNVDGSNFGADQTFTTPAVLPVIGTAAFASDIGTTGAHLAASLNPQNSDTTWHFDYGTDTSYGQSTPDQVLSALDDTAAIRGDTPIAGSTNGLTPGTLYHFRLVATNGAGTLDGPDQTFRTAPAALPSAEDITMNTATLTGVVNPDNDPSATYHFEFWFGFPPATSETSVGGTVDDLDHTVTAPISDLQAGHTYSVLLVATVHGQTVTSDLGQFTTDPPPTVTITGVSDVTQTSVRVNAIVDTHGLTGEYNLSFNSQSTPPLEIPNAAAGPQQVSVVLSDLLGDWSYTVTVLARASNGVLGLSEPFTFSTAPFPPRPTFGPPAPFDYPPSPPDDTGTTPVKPTRCPKGKVRKKVHGKSKCVKKPRRSGK